MQDALIGYSGFVGSTLLRQRSFESLYRSTNIDDIRSKSFDLVVCAGVPAQKWIANREPAEDRKKIDALILNLSQVQCRQFILISTIDVFKTPVGVDEDSCIEEEGLHPYGLHRRLLEKFVMQNFADHLIVRLPGLVGPGLRKNIIYDFHHDNNVDVIDSRGVFQFYPMVNLWYDLKTAVHHNLKTLHLTAEPLSVADVSLHGFGRVFNNVPAQGNAARYDMQSRYNHLFGGSKDHYQYSLREVIQAIRCYAQSEPKKT